MSDIQFIAPTEGRVVWYYPKKSETIARTASGRHAAIVADVVLAGKKEDPTTVVNLTVLDRDGHLHSRLCVQLIQPGQEQPDTGSREYCTWMPYQVGQAAKHADGGSGDSGDRLAKISSTLDLLTAGIDTLRRALEEVTDIVMADHNRLDRVEHTPIVSEYLEATYKTGPASDGYSRPYASPQDAAVLTNAEDDGVVGVEGGEVNQQPGEAQPAEEQM